MSLAVGITLLFVMNSLLVPFASQFVFQASEKEGALLVTQKNESNKIAQTI